MHQSPTLVAMTCVAVGIFAAPPAHACSCFPPETAIGIVPANGAVAPTDSLIWADGDALSGTAFELYDDASATTIALLNAPGWSGDWGEPWALQPERQLDPRTTYMLRQAGAPADAAPFVVFTTGDGPSTSRPAVPAVGMVSASAGLDTIPGMSLLMACGPKGGSYVATVDYVSTGVLDVLTLDPRSGAPDGPFDESIAARTATGTFTVGNGWCDPTDPDAGPLVRTNVRVGTFDVAGNFSGWSPATPVRYPVPGCSCDATSRQHTRRRTTSGVFAVCILLFATRKKR